MAIGYMEWHDGIGYDLNALAALSPDELLAAEDLLVARRASDWRDLEALDRIGSARALDQLNRALQSESVDIQIEAAQRLASRGLLTESVIEAIIIAALGRTTIVDGMVKTLNFAAAHPSAAVRRKLLACAVRGNDDLRVHAAALVHFCTVVRLPRLIWPSGLFTSASPPEIETKDMPPMSSSAGRSGSPPNSEAGKRFNPNFSPEAAQLEP
jgi:hypothetical protein